MSKTQLIESTTALNKQSASASLGRDYLLSIFDAVIGPGVFVMTLWAVAYSFEDHILPLYLILSVMVLALTFPSKARLQSLISTLIVDIPVNWVGIAGLLRVTGVINGYIRDFSKQALITWVWLAPLTEFSACLLLRATAPMLLKMQGPRQRAIIVGMNEQGLALAAKNRSSPYAPIDVTGFVDSRSVDQLAPTTPQKLMIGLSDLASLVKVNRIKLIYQTSNTSHMQTDRFSLGPIWQISAKTLLRLRHEVAQLYFFWFAHGCACNAAQRYHTRHKAVTRRATTQTPRPQRCIAKRFPRFQFG